MNEFTTNLGSINWWLTVVVVAIAVNFLSSFLYEQLGRLRVAAFDRLRERNDGKAERIKRAADFAAIDNTSFNSLVILQFQLYLGALFFVLVASAAIGIAQITSASTGPGVGVLRIVILGGSAILFCIGFVAFEKAQHLSSITRLAIEKKMDMNGAKQPPLGDM